MYAPQRQALEERAYRGDGVAPLLHFLALSGEWEALAQWTPRLDEADRLLLDALTLSQEPVAAEVLLPRLSTATPHVILLLVAQALLVTERFDQAGHLVACAMERDDPDPTVLNLVARAIRARGEQAMAAELVQVSLQLNPYQEDIAALPTTPPAQALPPAALQWTWAPEQVALYMPAYNAGPFLEQTVPALLEQAYPLEEVIVVDDGSSDDTAARARDLGVRVVQHPENRGLAAARNTAFANLNAAFVAAADSDVVLDPMFLWWAMQEFAVGGPKLAGVGGRLIETHTSTPADLWRSIHCGQDPGDLRKCPAMLFGADTVFRTRAILEAGGYDERFRTNSEDNDLCRRLREQGHHHAVARFAQAFHLRRDTEESVLNMLWNWAYWDRVSYGEFATIPGLIRGMVQWFENASKIIKADIHHYEDVLTDINFQAPFVWALRDVAMAVEDNLLPRGQAKALALALTEPLRISSSRRAIQAVEKVSIGIPEGEPEALLPSLRTALNTLDATARNFVATYENA